MYVHVNIVLACVLTNARYVPPGVCTDSSQGDENRVTDCLQRSRNSMQSVLQLDAVPDLEPSDDVHEHMNIQHLVSLYREPL